MIKDPFANIPDIEKDERDDHINDLEEPDVSISKGNSPKGIFKKLSSAMIPVAGLAIFAWLFWPSEGPVRKSVTEEKVVVVSSEVQGTNTSALINKLKNDAVNAPEPDASQAQTQAPPWTDKSTQRPASTTTHTSEKEAQDRLDLEKREGEIRASPMEAGQFTLMSEPMQNKALDQTRMRLDDAADEFIANRAAGMKQQSDPSERILEALKQKDDAGRKSTQNEEFLNSKDNAGDYQVYTQQQPISSTLISQGTVIRAVLLTGINSDLPGTVSAQVTANVYDSIHQQAVLIPKGSRLLGTYNSQVIPGQERLLVAMTRLILPNGSWIPLGGSTAADGQGQSGLSADVNNHFLQMFGSSLIIGASSFFLGGRDTTSSTNSADGSKSVSGSILGVALNETVKNLMERNRKISPTLSNRPGDEFLFLVSKDLIMKPFKRQ
jgi:type IV secretory pathway VirB10-like protein